MATGGKGALSLLQNYSSDSEGDSGYTSEDDKKRKQEFRNPHERKRKKRRGGGEEEEEDMMVDTPSASSRQSTPHNTLSSTPPQHLPHSTTATTTTHITSSSSRSTIPLPDELLQEREDHVDDPRQHQGRVRSFPHERGNWASLLYVPLHLGVYGASFTSLLSSLVSTCRDNQLTLTPSADLHISLSQTLVLHLHLIHPLTQDLRARLGGVTRFSLWLHGLGIYINEERTRTFLGLRVCHGREELHDITAEVDKCLAEYRLPPFYKDGSYHASIAWCVGDATEDLRRLLPQLENVCSQYFSIESDMRTFDIPTLSFKTGNRTHSIPLAPSK
ncbi:hypothetical protein Pcinc_014793 [Petrolisthes cinctipes]|uniref:U6 snRNA phosphodiesterase n=1 Tax=Petrolisthes cinctipes TaxID=88211 RepID=A0AAE1KR29_PETCI|nr:hypothetical protein Pcinc_039116 [Petrolisthes cinctipes]KAK3880733.1 hypothetical protein Pcinc_014793 [Petrolisthes cinctipes]